VYRGAARLALNGGSLYGGPIWHWAPFTYPPLAALVFAPMALLPLPVDELLLTSFGAIALFAILALALRLPTSDPEHASPRLHRRSVVLPLAAAAALWLEPITATLGYGQINLLIALLVVGDLARRDTARSKGALIGLAAGLKLTPLIFIPYLLCSRRPRAATVAIGTFASTVAAGYAALPAATQRFWGGGLFLDSRRVGGAYVPANQSLRGLILRLDPSFGSARLLAVAMVFAIVALLLAVRASRRGDEAVGFSLCAITGLLVSPVSWTHHWTLAVPAMLLLGTRVVTRRSTHGIAAVSAAVLVGYSYLPKLMTKPAFAPGRGQSIGWTLASSSYVLVGLAGIGLACTHEIRLFLAGRSGKRPARRQASLCPTSQPVASSGSWFGERGSGRAAIADRS
jgi:alpha-1,2-mannosyltransferase